MAYKYLVAKYYATWQAQHDAIKQLLLDAGWTVEYTAAGSHTVMKSVCTANDGISLFLRINMTGGSVTSYMNWSGASATGAAIASGSVVSGASGQGTGTRLYAYADLDSFVMFSINNGTVFPNVPIIVARLVPRAGSFTTTVVTEFASSASPVVISVADNSQFVVDSYYHCVDIAAGKRFGFKCTAKGTGTITAEAVGGSGNWAVGSLIGVNVYPVLASDASNYASLGHPHVPYSGVPTTSNSYARIHKFISDYGSCAEQVDGGDFLGSNNKDRRLFPLTGIEYVGTSSGIWNKVGTSDIVKFSRVLSSTYWWGITTPLGNGDVQGFGVIDSGISSGGNGSTYLNDTSKNWTDSLIDYVVIIGGTGNDAGQIAKITGSSLTQIVFDTMAVIPNASPYWIVAEAYRAIVYQQANMFFREGV